MKGYYLLSLFVILFFLPVFSYAKEIGFTETFALAKDREKSLEELIPQTQDYYYYHCLHAQNTGNYKLVNALLEEWISAFHHSRQAEEIKNRQMLLEYQTHPDATINYLKDYLNLTYSHTRPGAEKSRSYPGKLDENLISVSALMEKVISRHRGLNGINERGLEYVSPSGLSPNLLREFLGRLTIPDIPDLPALVVKDLKHPKSRGFGSLSIHSNMTKQQMVSCLREYPELIHDGNFVNIYLARFHPGNDTSMETSREEKRNYLETIWKFAGSLGNSFNSLKLHTLYHLLVLDREEGLYSREKFLAYLAIPRNTDYINPDYLRNPSLRRNRADLFADFSHATGLSRVEDDRELIADYLARFLVDEKNYKPYLRYLSDEFVKKIFAETKIVNGVGKVESYAPLLDAKELQALKERVDIDFAYTNPEFVPVDADVSLDLFVKNVETLIVKVYAVNAFNYYKENQKEIDPGIGLNGYRATSETIHDYQESPFIRKKRTFTFPKMQTPGVYVVDFIGGGKNSRSVVKKGRLFAIEKQGAAGHEFIIVDEKNQRVETPSIWMEQREYLPEDDGVIIIPYSTKPGKQTIILTDGKTCSLWDFHHMAETCSLDAGFTLERESLVQGKTATLLVRPVLNLSGRYVSLELLEEPGLSVLMEDIQGIRTERTISSFAIQEDKESVFSFPVPENLRSVTFTLSAKVKNVSKNKEETLTSQKRFEVNQVDTTMHVREAYLMNTQKGYKILVLGKNGERCADIPLNITIMHSLFTEPVHTTLQTDKNGAVFLGKLPLIRQIRTSLPEGRENQWDIQPENPERPSAIHAAAGETIQIPYPYPVGEEKRHMASLFQIAGQDIILEDFGNSLDIAPGSITLSGLPPGDYRLFIKPENLALTIRVTRNRFRGLPVIGGVENGRILDAGDTAYILISKMEANNSEISFHIQNPGQQTRVHVFATRFVPEFPVKQMLSHMPPSLSSLQVLLPETRYLTGRTIGEEDRYILERKYRDKYPGNMLPRPELLLNPFVLQKTDTTTDTADKGDVFQAEAEAAQPMRDGRMHREKRGKSAYSDSHTMDFFPYPAVVIPNLVPDQNGVVTISKDQLKAQHHIQVAAVTPLHCAVREFILPESPLSFDDLRYKARVAENTAITEKKKISSLAKGESLKIQSGTGGEQEIYETLEQAFSLLHTLSDNSTLEKFRFITKWQELPEEEKQSKYSEYACHELHFFLYHRDPAFFASVVKPYIENKRRKTFLDEWLLGKDLKKYLDPMRFHSLNVVEKILMAGRISGNKDSITGFIKDRYDLLPDDREKFNRLFDTALRGRSLEKDMLSADIDEPTEELAPAPMSMGMDVSAAGPEMDDAEMMMEAQDHTRLMKAMPSAAMPAPRAPSGFGDARAERRKKMRPLYRAPDKTKEWAENHYYELPLEKQNESLVTINPFWMDFAFREEEKPFLSGNFIYATKNFTELMLALSVLDLPFEKQAHAKQTKEGALTLTAGSPVIIFQKEISKAAIRKGEEDPPLVLIQRYYDPDDMYRYEGNEQVMKYVSGGFLFRKPYGSRLVVSNPSGERKKALVLFQIPNGALPVYNGFYAQGFPVTVEPYQAVTLTCHFYFPETGEFRVAPATAKLDKGFVEAKAVTFSVVQKLSGTDKDSWTYISENGTEKEVLGFLETRNLNRIDLSRMLFRMKDKGFYKKAVSVLSARNFYHNGVWSFSLYHHDRDRIQEFLSHSQLAHACGMVLDSPLLQIDPVVRGMYEHLEYKPLINARKHRLGENRKILNDRFCDQYTRFMHLLTYKNKFSQNDLAAIAYYLFLQDRISEGIAFFEKIDPETIKQGTESPEKGRQEALETAIQYDYLKAYIGFYTGRMDQSETIAKSYMDYPVNRWRNRFAEILHQLHGEGIPESEAIDPEDRDALHSMLAATEAGFEFEVKEDAIHLHYRNLTSCRIEFYPMEIEFLFSKNPFMKNEDASLAYIRPDFTMSLALAENKTTHTVEIPEKYTNTDMLIGISAKGKRKTKVVSANQIGIHLARQYGQVIVSRKTNGVPLPGVYVKVYARMNNQQVEFYKDGYTDHRGRFDYASLSTDTLDNVTRFAVLLVSDNLGARIVETGPPKQ